MAPPPVLLPGKFHGRRSLVGCSPWGREESDMTDRLHFHFSLSCIGEGNGNPLRCSCLENSRDGRAWWAAVYGVAQCQTRLKLLSSSNSKEFVPLAPFPVRVLLLQWFLSGSPVLPHVDFSKLSPLLCKESFYSTPITQFEWCHLFPAGTLIDTISNQENNETVSLRSTSCLNSASYFEVLEVKVLVAELCLTL